MSPCNIALQLTREVTITIRQCIMILGKWVKDSCLGSTARATTHTSMSKAKSKDSSSITGQCQGITIIAAASTIEPIFHSSLTSHNTTKPPKIDRYLSNSSIHTKENQVKSLRWLKTVLNSKTVLDNSSAAITTRITALIGNQECYPPSNTSSSLSHWTKHRTRICLLLLKMYSLLVEFLRMKSIIDILLNQLALIKRS